MTRTKLVIVFAALAVAALSLGGCSMAGSAVQGVGTAFNKTGGAIKNLGN